MKASALFIVVLLLVVTVVVAQWPNNNNGQQPYPNFPQQPSYNDICSRPGANCVSQTCDSNGNCHTTNSGAVSVTGTYTPIWMACGMLMAVMWRRF